MSDLLQHETDANLAIFGSLGQRAPQSDEVVTDDACRQLGAGEMRTSIKPNCINRSTVEPATCDRDTERFCDIIDHARRTIERKQDHFFNRTPSPSALDDGARVIVPGGKVDFHTTNLPFSSILTTEAPLLLTTEPPLPTLSKSVATSRLSLRQHLSKELKLIVHSVGIDFLDDFANEPPTCGKDQLLPGAAEQHVHALRVFEEPERARSRHNIVAREAGDDDIGFASLEAVARKEKLSIAAGAGEAE